MYLIDVSCLGISARNSESPKDLLSRKAEKK